VVVETRRTETERDQGQDLETDAGEIDLVNVPVGDDDALDQESGGVVDVTNNYHATRKRVDVQDTAKYRYHVHHYM